MFKKMNIATLLIVGLLCFGSSVSAQIYIEQGKIELDVNQGGREVGAVTIHNTTNQEVNVKAYWEDFSYQPPYDGTKKFLPSGATDNSLGNWVSFSPQEFSMPAFAKKEISFVVNVPKDATSGGYYGVMFFENVGQDYKTETGVRVVTRVGTLFFIETNDKVKRSQLSKISLEEGYLKGKFINQGNVILLPEGTYYIVDQDGIVADRGKLKNMYVPPAAEANLVVKVSDDISVGRYTMIVTIDLKGGDVLVKEIEFEKVGLNQYEVLNILD